MSENKSVDDFIRAAVESIRQVVDVDMIIGKQIETPDGFVIIPVSRISLGFGAGGMENGKNIDIAKTGKVPYGGGTGAGVSISPVGFLVVGNGQVRLLNIENNSPLDSLIAAAPQAVDFLRQFAGKKSTEEKAVNQE